MINEIILKLQNISINLTTLRIVYFPEKGRIKEEPVNGVYQIENNRLRSEDGIFHEEYQAREDDPRAERLSGSHFFILTKDTRMPLKITCRAWQVSARNPSLFLIVSIPSSLGEDQKRFFRSYAERTGGERRDNDNFFSRDSFSMNSSERIIFTNFGECVKEDGKWRNIRNT